MNSNSHEVNKIYRSILADVYREAYYTLDRRLLRHELPGEMKLKGWLAPTFAMTEVLGDPYAGFEGNKVQIGLEKINPIIWYAFRQPDILIEIEGKKLGRRDKVTKNQFILSSRGKLRMIDGDIDQEAFREQVIRVKRAITLFTGNI